WLNIFIRNISVYDYGHVAIALPYSSAQVLTFKLWISSEGPRNVSFGYARNEKPNDWNLFCKAYDYPKMISIGKKSLSNLTLEVSRNTKLNSSLTLKASPRSFKCDDIGTYQCNVTNFQNKTKSYELHVFLENCTGIMKLCDWQP
ncbi:unnamed protein product, partial [Lymnaea stagnalis]